MRDGACPLAPGSVAPNFALYQSPGQSLSLESLRGQRVVLAFYPALWEPATDAQVALHQRWLPELDRRSAQLLGISVDSVWSQRAYRRHYNVGYLLLSDCEPKGHVARAYGIYAAGTGACRRAIFVLDEQGRIAWCRTYPTNLIPAIDGIITALDRLARELLPPPGPQDMNSTGQ